MTVLDIIEGYYNEKEETGEYAEFANQLYQDAIRITMQINSFYHTPEELVTLMSELTGKEVDQSFRLFTPILEKILL